MSPETNDTQEASQHANAVSIFGTAGNSNDFPVLKAFQEYIDAEQAKARKRMLGLSVFFILLLVVVVVTFTLIMTSVINRNQILSDRLLDIALRDKTSSAQPVVNVQQPAPQPVLQQPSQVETLKPVLEKFDKLAEVLTKNQMSVPMTAPAPVVVTTGSPSPVLQPSTAESTELTRLREELRREKEAREAERKKAEEAKRQAEKEAFLRRQYPDYYAQQDSASARLPAPLPHKSQSTLKGMQPISYFGSSQDDPELEKLLSDHKLKAQKSPKPALNAKPSVNQQPTAVPAQKVIPQKHAEPPRAIKKELPPPPAKPQATKAQTQSNATATTKTETISIGGTADGSSIPWLIEQQKTK